MRNFRTTIGLFFLFMLVLSCSNCGEGKSKESVSDSTPPVLSNGSPAGILSAGTTETTLSLNTNEGATCRYDVISGVNYSSMSSAFQNTGGTSHVNALTGLEDGEDYTYYVRCEDASGNSNGIDYSISFSIDLKTSTVAISNIYTMNEGNKLHATTRGTIDLVHLYQGTWFVFHGASQDPCCEYNGYQTSSDGIVWSGLKTGVNSTADQIGRSFLIEGNKIIKIYSLDIDPDPNIWNPELYICEGSIDGVDIVWDTPQIVMPADSINSWSYYNDLKRDASGRIHFSGRHSDGTFTNTFWMSAQNPYDNSTWESPFMVALGDVNTGVDGHENIQLDGDEVYVLARTNSLVYVPGTPGKFYGRHFDGTDWEGTSTELGVSDGINGSDKRLSAIFDPNGYKVHLVYIDDQGNLFHRTLSKPYDSSDWSAPVLIENDVFTCTMGIDTSASPSLIAVVYGKQLEADGGRFHTGDLFLKWFDGQTWESNSLLVSEAGTSYNWYPNMIRDVSGDIGVMYLKGHWGASSLDIMFSLIQF